jgi:RHS repeat-associated protein
MAGGGTVTYDSGNWALRIGSSCSFQPAQGSNLFPYGAGSTPASLATALAADINSICSQVTATASSGVAPNTGVVTVTATTLGAGGDYSVSVGLFGYNNQYFASPSFTLTPSGSTMTGGSPVYDSGTYQVVVSSGQGACTVSVPYRSTSTQASLAAALKTNINSSCSSLVTASNTTNSPIVTFTSTVEAAGADYAIQTSMTGGVSSTFPNGSFTLTPSGSTMTGGAGGTFYSYQVPSGTAGYYPNGNLHQFSDSVMGTWQFNYDTLNRLTTSLNTAVTSTSSQFANMNGCWTYDDFGNRESEAMSTTPCSNNPPQASWVHYNVSNSNRMDSTNQNTNQGTNGYDGAGDVTYDGENSYLYDAEGRLCAVNYTVSGTTSLIGYLYDASGTRVGKGSLSSWPSTPSSTTCNSLISSYGYMPTDQYLLGQGGEQVSELNGSGVTQHTNIFAGGKLLATYDFAPIPGLHFALTDPLGTKRVQISGAGAAELDCMSLPFGNGLGNPRTTDCIPVGGYYDVDATEHHFTGKERDAESGNDYFGARYYASSMGRFMSPDWSAKVEPIPYSKLDDPQSLNLYAYVTNNPLVKVDADGHAGDIAVIEDGPTDGNPVGHTAIAITGRGVYSFGTNTALGSSTTGFLQMESGRRDQRITIIKTTPEQDAAAAKALTKQNEKGDINKYPDNCSARSNAGLDAAGIPQVGPDQTKIGQQSPLAISPGADPSIPGTAGARAEAAGGKSFEIPKGGAVPDSMKQFNPAPGQAPVPENKQKNTGSS